MKIKSCYVYARVASRELPANEGNNSIVGQLKRCELYAKKNGYKVLNTFVDVGLSGRTLHRDGLKDLLYECDMRPVDVIIIDRIDRIARSVIDFQKVKNMLLANEINIISVSEGYISSKASISDIFASVAEWESERRGLD